jgi:hypothetical protein
VTPACVSWGGGGNVKHVKRVAADCGKLFAGLSVLATLLLMSPIFVFLRDVWIRTQGDAVASRHATNFNLATYLPKLSHLSP